MLKEELSMYKTPNELLPGAQLAEIDSQVQRFLDGSLKEITVTSIRQAQALFAQIKLAVQEQKQKVMAQLCHKCSLAEKNQNGNIGAIKVMEQDTRGGSDDVEAGSTGTSAQSPKQTRDPSSTTSKTVKLRDKQSQRKRQGGGSPASRKRSESASKSKLNSAQMPEREQESQKPDTESLDSQPPENKSFPPGVVSLPPKAEAFEDFKAGQGHMITCILKDNKAVLLERRGLLRQLTEDVSAVKRKIDCTTATIQQRKEMRETQGQYLVMEEEEELDDTLILQLRELKTLYQQRCAALRDIKAEVNYCQHLVDQCTVRLLSEFETWYKKTCLFPEEELQMTMSLAKWNKALSITPMQNSSSAGSGQRRHFPIPPVT
uniref:kinesin-like protein KIF9 n=1 Tax=Monopterus albus TaxID=43700 RepID=UPI0009B4CC78|nr:kinesin-like protein KIF9 [Monopterus albus]